MSLWIEVSSPRTRRLEPKPSPCYARPMPILTATLLVTLATTAAPSTDPPCYASETAIVILTSTHDLFLCENGRAIDRYTVALGSGGTGKRREGDDRTPLGSYPLSLGRPSKEFGTFLPVGYPTPAQRRQGFTGGAIGIHGPKRGARWLGRMGTVVDWTRGCVAVASDAQIKAVTSWVGRTKAAVVRIERGR